MIRASQSVVSAALGAALLGLAACSSTPPPPNPLTAPPVQVRVAHFQGPLLAGPTASGPDAETVEPDLSTARVAHLRILYLEEIPRTLDALATRATLVIGARGSEVLLPTTVLAVGGRVGLATENEILQRADGERIRSVPVANLRALIAPDATAVFAAASERSRLLDNGEEVRRQLSVFVSEQPQDSDPALGRFQVSLMTEDTVPGNSDLNPEVVQRQLVVLDRAPAEDGTPLTLLFPSPFPGEDGRGFAAFLTLEPFDPDLPGSSALVERWRSDLQEAAAIAFERATRPTLMETRARALQVGVDSLDDRSNPRTTLIFLAESVSSELALDLALTATEPDLELWLDLLQQEFEDFRSSPLGDAEPGALRWALEKNALSLIADELDRDELSNELRGTLIRNAGEVGRSAPALRGIVQRSNDSQEMQAELVVENRSYLDSSEPSSRVRAYDWLAARDLAPADYDPLAPRPERRAALDADLQRRRAAEMVVPGNPMTEGGPR